MYKISVGRGGGLKSLANQGVGRKFILQKEKEKNASVVTKVSSVRLCVRPSPEIRFFSGILLTKTVGMIQKAGKKRSMKELSP